MGIATGNLVRWVALFCACIVAAAFVHECGHGLGARLAGIHVSTGFNRVGLPGKAPGDPDFRRGLQFSLAGTAAGPLASLLFAAGALALMPARPSGTTAWLGGLAVTSAGVRFFPLTIFIAAALAGKPRLEDEVGIGMYLAGQAPDPSRPVASDQMQPFLRQPVFWLAPSISLLASLFLLACSLRRLTAAYAGNGDRLPASAFYLSPALAFLLMTPLLNLLDRHVRLNW